MYIFKWKSFSYKDLTLIGLFVCYMLLWSDIGVSDKKKTASCEENDICKVLDWYLKNLGTHSHIYKQTDRHRGLAKLTQLDTKITLWYIYEYSLRSLMFPSSLIYLVEGINLCICVNTIVCVFLTFSLGTCAAWYELLVNDKCQLKRSRRSTTYTQLAQLTMPHNNICKFVARDLTDKRLRHNRAYAANMNNGYVRLNLPVHLTSSCVLLNFMRCQPFHIYFYSVTNAHSLCFLQHSICVCMCVFIWFGLWVRPWVFDFLA